MSEFNINELRNEWADVCQKASDEKYPSASGERAIADFLTKVRSFGRHVNYLKTRGELQDLAREVADYIFASTGEYPSAVIEPPSDKSHLVLAFQADISRIVEFAPPELVGRNDELQVLNDAWEKVQKAESPRPHVLTFVALGGEGKTSLVAKWAADLAYQGWQECEAVFAWTFYSQGTRERTMVSSDVFFKEALTVFGDPEMANGAKTAFDKGRRLAQLVGGRRALLILDGLEPLQYAPTSPIPGELKDQGIAALLKGLATSNQGLCVVTTRYSVTDLKNYWQTTAPETKLLRLSKAAGVLLLQKLGVKGAQKEFETLVDDVKGHALTLNLLGTYLYDAHAGDIRKRDLVKLEEANAEEQGGHAFRLMDAYVKWFASDGERGKPALAVLRLLALFDRPVTADCLSALLNAPAISGLTEAIVGMSEPQQNVLFTRLESAKLLTVNRGADGALLALDAHPLLREYFAQQLRTEHPGAWRAAHQQLYKHLCETAKDNDEPTLEDLQPLYQAVAHGCQAGMQEEALVNVYKRRILGDNYYSTKKLGALGTDLGAIACFFEQPWSRLSPALKKDSQAWLFNEAAVRLRSLGRLTEALEPMRAGIKGAEDLKEWKDAAQYAGNLSALQLTLGAVTEALRDAKQSVSYADRSGDMSQMIGKHAAYADALHQSGDRTNADAHFREAEALQVKCEPEIPFLYYRAGFLYCDLLLADPERAAWLSTLASEAAQEPRRNGQDAGALLESCREVSQRAAKTLPIAKEKNWILGAALDHLTLGRASLYEAILGGSTLDPYHASLQHAVDGLRRAGSQYHLPRGLLTRAWLRSLTGTRTGPESAQTDLDEAWETAERGPMPLFLADIHLYRARLFSREMHYPWNKNADGTTRGPKDDLAAARRLIEKHGYWRRKEELENAEETILRNA